MARQEEAGQSHAGRQREGETPWAAKGSEAVALGARPGPAESIPRGFAGQVPWERAAAFPELELRHGAEALS